MIKVLDNVISEKYSYHLFEECCKLKWTFVPDISYGSEAERSVPGFSYSFFLDKEFNNYETVTIKEPEYSLVTPMLLEAFDKLGTPFTIKDVFRSRARLTIDRPELPEDKRIDNKHIDYKTKHLVLIYYVNSTDGDTIFFEGDKIIERITPRRSRVVLFDGSIVHASSTSSLSPRIIINNNIRLPV